MNKKIENRRSANSATLNVLKANDPIYAADLPLKELVIALENKLTELNDYRITQETAITGYTDQKNAGRFNLVQSSIQYSGRVMSYAAATNKPELYAAVKYSETALLKCRDTVLIDRCSVILQAINAHAAALIDYGITATMVTDFDEAIAKYRNSHQTPRAMKANVKNATANITRLDKETAELLKKSIDNHMLGYKITNPDFYAQYKNARKIIDLSGVRTTLRGHMIDEQTTQKLRGLVIIQETGETLYANPKGNFHKAAPEGVFTLIAKVPGFEDKIIHGVTLHKGKVNNIDIRLRKAA